MYYGTAGGAKVSIDHKSNFLEINDAADFSFGYKLPADDEWTLTSRYNDLFVKVTAAAVHNCDKRVIISMLLSGLKQIQDSEIYHASVASIETSMGFTVDRNIVAEASEITDAVLWSDKCEFEVRIHERIGAYTIGMPKMECQYIQDIDIFRVKMLVNVGSWMKSKMDFSAETWHEEPTECAKIAQRMMLETLYAERPNYSSAISQLMYSVFDNQMNVPSPQSMAYVFKNVGGWIPSEAEYANSPKPYYSFEPDRRVNQLPGLNKMVKHPVTGVTTTLQNVIITLNDKFRWTREKIADWLETLDIDLSFKVEE